MSFVFFYSAQPKFAIPGPNGIIDSVDLLPTMREEKKLFMPYVLWRDTVVKPGFTDYVTDIVTPSDRLKGVGSQWGWSSDKLASRTRQHTAVANLIRDVDLKEEGERWAVVPRLREGVCYVAKIESQYTIWPKASHWISSIRSQLAQHGVAPSALYAMLADAAQGWDTSEWKRISLTALPRWFWIQTCHRGSFSRLSMRPGYPLPEVVAAAAYNDPFSSPLPPPAASIQEIERMLAEKLSPAALEFLCVELLNLSTTGNCALWVHVGGVGDGGVDGIGFDLLGSPSWFLSVKWQIGADTEIRDAGIDGNAPLVVAYLLGSPPVPKKHWTVWSSAEIAKLVWNHRNVLSRSFKSLLGV